jgi:hypothetical protein
MDACFGAFENEADMVKGQRFTFTIEPDLYEPLKVQAKKERRSIGSLLNYLAAKYLEEQQGIAIEPTIQHGGDRKSDAVRKADEEDSADSSANNNAD